MYSGNRTPLVIRESLGEGCGPAIEVIGLYFHLSTTAKKQINIQKTKRLEH